MSSTGYCSKACIAYCRMSGLLPYLGWKYRTAVTGGTAAHSGTYWESSVSISCLQLNFLHGTHLQVTLHLRLKTITQN